MSGLQEIKIFNHSIVISFSDLQEDLENIVYKKLSEQEFYNIFFEVINIINFEIKEMLVSGLTVICDILLTAVCNVPSIGKNITINNFEIKNGNIIYTEGRIQIIAKLNNKPVQNEYVLCIEALKIVSKNILCVAILV